MPTLSVRMDTSKREPEIMPQVQTAIGSSEENVIPYGYCHCGCGGKTELIKINNKAKNLVKGEPYKFITRHYKRTTGSIKLKQFCKQGHERIAGNIMANGGCKKCGNNNSERWRNRNPIKMQQLRKNWNNNNPDYSKEYYYRDLEKTRKNARQYAVKYYAKNSEKLRHRTALYRIKYPAKIKERDTLVVQNMKLCYVAKTLHIPVINLTTELTELKRATLLLHRRIYNVRQI